MVDVVELDKLKSTFHRGASSMFVFGSGMDESCGLPSFSNSDHVKALFGDGDVGRAWARIIKESSVVEPHRFLKNYTNFVNDTAPVKLSRFLFLKTGIYDFISNVACGENSVVFDLYGSINKGLDAGGSLVDVNDETNLCSVSPIFMKSKEGLDSRRDIVEFVESAVSDHDVLNLFLIGVSGGCPVVESVYNHALVTYPFKKMNIIVVNPDESCFMHDNATISIKSDGWEFLSALDDFLLNTNKEYKKYVDEK